MNSIFSLAVGTVANKSTLWTYYLQKNPSKKQNVHFEDSVWCRLVSSIVGSMQGNWSSENPRMDAIDQLSEALVELGDDKMMLSHIRTAR